MFYILIFLITSNVFGIHKEKIEELQYLYNNYYLVSYWDQILYIKESTPLSVQEITNWIYTESNFNPYAFNRRTNDKGLVQLHDVDYLVNKYWDKDYSFNIWDGRHNLYVGGSYLIDLISEFGKEHGIIAYNTGPTRVRRGKILKFGIEYCNKIVIPDIVAEVNIIFIGDNSSCTLVFTSSPIYDKREYISEILYKIFNIPLDYI